MTELEKELLILKIELKVLEKQCHSKSLVQVCIPSLLLLAGYCLRLITIVFNFSDMATLVLTSIVVVFAGLFTILIWRKANG